MKNFSEFSILGNIGKVSKVGAATKINIAANYPQQDKNGEWLDDTHWATVTVFGEHLQNKVAAYTIGDTVLARGRIRNGSYDKNGETIYTTDLVAFEFGRVAKRGEADESHA